VRHQRREQRREGGRAERGAQGLHEPDAGGGDPEVAPLDRGVHEQHLVAKPESEAGPEHDHDGIEHGDRDPRRAERETAERQRRHGRAADDRGLHRPAGPGDPLAEQRAESEPGRDRKQLQAGLDGGRAAHDLEVERQVDDARGHPQPGCELQQGDGAEGRMAQQPGRKERLAGASLPPAERAGRRQAEPRAPEDLDRRPGELMTAPLADREQAGRRHR
jgi:hypothetical protein